MDYYSKLQSRLPSSSSSSSNAAYFPPHRTQLHPRMHYSNSSTPSKPSPFSSLSSSSQSRLDHLWWWVAAATVLIVPFLFYLFAASRRTHLSFKFASPNPKGFGVVIDAGASGSRVHVFEYLNEGTIPFVGFEGKGSVSLKVRPGLRAFWDHPEGAGKSLLDLLDFARGVVPRAEWGKTKVRLMESGGLRGVEVDASRKILESCRSVLRSSGFLFREEWVSLVTGQEKGVYAWVASNYALGTLGGDPQETNGIVEIDEGSMQITFVSSEPPPLDFAYILKLPSVSYNLYTSSISQNSQEGAWEFLDVLHNSKVITASPSSSDIATMNPCIPKGYTQTYSINIPSSSSDHNLFADSWGNFSACRSKALKLLKEGQGICSNPPCGIVSTLVPKLHELSINAESLFYISEFFGLGPRASLLDLETSGKHYCQDDWAKLRGEHLGVDEADLLKYCFTSAYMVALLHDGIGISMDEKRIGLTDLSGKAPPDWTLGAFILQLVVEPELKPDYTDGIAGDDAVTYLTLFAILFFAILAMFFVLRWQRPQFKMIYDLEKGHYIVTRMPR